MQEYIIGIDIGGTKCAITLGLLNQGDLEILENIRFLTLDVHSTIQKIIITIENLLKKKSIQKTMISAIGISCGGPLDSTGGIILSPPNLPGWDNIPIVELIQKRFPVPVGLQNDANACALAEWKFGAGKGVNNMVFMTFGTGLGAGLILDGRLYAGSNDNAGEIGHIRLNEHGPVGYGKSGSFEGFCSGNGIAQLARVKILEKLQLGETVSWCKLDDINNITAQKVAEEAFKGDELALEVMRISSKKLGQGLAIIIDILNPELIVIGGIFARCYDLMVRPMQEILNQEALSYANQICRVVPAVLGEDVGAYSALSVATNQLQKIR